MIIKASRHPRASRSEDDPRDFNVIFFTMENKNIIQSYLFSRLRSRMNIHEMRILLRIVERAQDELRGVVLRDNKGPLAHGLAGTRVEFPLRELLAPGSHHYELARAACNSVVGKVVEHFDSGARKWYTAALVPQAVIDEQRSVVTLYILDWVWDTILDFTHGFVKVDLTMAMRLRSPYSLKLYFLMSGQPQPIQYSINELYKLFGVVGKYSRTNDFIKRVIEPAIKELKGVSPWACDFRPLKDGRSISYIMFYPFEQKDKYSPTIVEKNLMARTGSVFLEREVYTYMRYNMGFEHIELLRNKSLVEQLGRKMTNPVGFLADLRERALRQGRSFGKGYYINAIKSELAQITANSAPLSSKK